MCERFDVSDRAGAAIASAVLKDFGVIDDGNLADAIDRSKLRRERQKYRQKLRDDEKCNFEIVDAIYVDGRKDVTLTTIKTGDLRFYPKVETEEHYVVVGKPRELYLTHLSVEDGKGTTIGQALYKATENTDLQNTLSTIGSDGTPIMTGKHHGSIATLEELLQIPLQWAICLLHTNELPLRHVFKHLDGVSASPDSFSGPIGKELNGLVSDWKVVNFRSLSSIEFPYLPQEVIQNLSSDQFYTYQICRAVISRKVENDLAQLEVGGLSHARWLTLGCRILRFYTSQTKPTKNLKILVEFCLKIYFSSWFDIKPNSKITDAAVNYFRMLK